jgi:hypothetical protein
MEAFLLQDLLLYPFYLASAMFSASLSIRPRPRHGRQCGSCEDAWRVSVLFKSTTALQIAQPHKPFIPRGIGSIPLYLIVTCSTTLDPKLPTQDVFRHSSPALEGASAIFDKLPNLQWLKFFSKHKARVAAKDLIPASGAEPKSETNNDRVMPSADPYAVPHRLDYRVIPVTLVRASSRGRYLPCSN